MWGRRSRAQRSLKNFKNLQKNKQESLPASQADFNAMTSSQALRHLVDQHIDETLAPANAPPPPPLKPVAPPAKTAPAPAPLVKPAPTATPVKKTTSRIVAPARPKAPVVVTPPPKPAPPAKKPDAGFQVQPAKVSDSQIDDLLNQVSDKGHIATPQSAMATEPAQPASQQPSAIPAAIENLNETTESTATEVQTADSQDDQFVDLNPPQEITAAPAVMATSAPPVPASLITEKPQPTHSSDTPATQKTSRLHKRRQPPANTDSVATPPELAPVATEGSATMRKDAASSKDNPGRRKQQEAGAESNNQSGRVRHDQPMDERLFYGMIASIVVMVLITLVVAYFKFLRPRAVPVREKSNYLQNSTPAPKKPSIDWSELEVMAGRISQAKALIATGNTAAEKHDWPLAVKNLQEGVDMIKSTASEASEYLDKMEEKHGADAVRAKRENLPKWRQSIRPAMMGLDAAKTQLENSKSK